MATINELRRQRIAAFKDLRAKLRTADSSLEVAERFINSILSRKNKIPTADDLKKITGFLQSLDQNVNTVINLIGTLAVLFGGF